jgi:undecaprenyl-diphosphatase
MIDASAAWAAEHALLLFILLPCLAALLALGAARAWLAVEARGRTVLGAGGAGLALLVFLALAVAVRRPGAVVAFDGALANALGRAMPDAFLWLLSWFTFLGDRDLLALSCVLAVLWLLWRGYKGLALFCAVATGLGGALNWLLKYGFQRLRPDFNHDYTAVVGWSFPSGHASAAMAVYGTACYLIWRLAPAPWRRPSLALAAALVTAIGLSRVLLQVHFASDVAAGWAISLAWMILCLGLAEGLRASGRDAGQRVH